MLKRDGYAGLTTAKVAAASGQNKGLIAYYFGSKMGLVAEAARAVGEELTRDVLGSVGEPKNVEELVGELVEGLQGLLERDPGLQRVYFDLASQSVVEPELATVLAEVKAFHRGALIALLADIPGGPAPDDHEAAAIYVIAGLEGLALERLDRGDTPALSRARELFVAAAPGALGATRP